MSNAELKEKVKRYENLIITMRNEMARQEHEHEVEQKKWKETMKSKEVVVKELGKNMVSAKKQYEDECDRLRKLHEESVKEQDQLFEEKGEYLRKKFQEEMTTKLKAYAEKCKKDLADAQDEYRNNVDAFYTKEMIRVNSAAQKVLEERQVIFKEKIIYKDKIVEKEVIKIVDKIIEKPIEVFVDKIVEIEKIVYVDRVVEVLVEKEKEKIIEKDKIIFKDLIIKDVKNTLILKYQKLIINLKNKNFERRVKQIFGMLIKAILKRKQPTKVKKEPFTDDEEFVLMKERLNKLENQVQQILDQQQVLFNQNQKSNNKSVEFDKKLQKNVLTLYEQHVDILNDFSAMKGLGNKRHIKSIRQIKKMKHELKNLNKETIPEIEGRIVYQNEIILSNVKQLNNVNAKSSAIENRLRDLEQNFNKLHKKLEDQPIKEIIYTGKVEPILKECHSKIEQVINQKRNEFQSELQWVKTDVSRELHSLERMKNQFVRNEERATKVQEALESLDFGAITSEIKAMKSEAQFIFHDTIKNLKKKSASLIEKQGIQKNIKNIKPPNQIKQNNDNSQKLKINQPSNKPFGSSNDVRRDSNGKSSLNKSINQKFQNINPNVLPASLTINEFGEPILIDGERQHTPRRFRSYKKNEMKNGDILLYGKKEMQIHEHFNPSIWVGFKHEDHNSDEWEIQHFANLTGNSNKF